MQHVGLEKNHLSYINHTFWHMNCSTLSVIVCNYAHDIKKLLLCCGHVCWCSVILLQPQPLMTLLIAEYWLKLQREFRRPQRWSEVSTSENRADTEPTESTAQLFSFFHSKMNLIVTGDTYNNIDCISPCSFVSLALCRRFKSCRL